LELTVLNIALKIVLKLVLLMEHFMNTLPATEIKRRGVAAIDESIKFGPIHIIKNNHLKYVILLEEDYEKLLSHSIPLSNAKTSLWEMLENRPWSGQRKKTDIKNQIKRERDTWKK
jgi:hypothetical protein